MLPKQKLPSSLQKLKNRVLLEVQKKLMPMGIPNTQITEKELIKRYPVYQKSKYNVSQQLLTITLRFTVWLTPKLDFQIDWFLNDIQKDMY